MFAWVCCRIKYSHKYWGVYKLSRVNSVLRSNAEVRGVRVGDVEVGGDRVLRVESGSVFVVLEECSYMEYDYFVFMVGGEVIKSVFYMGEFLGLFEELE